MSGEARRVVRWLLAGSLAVNLSLVMLLFSPVVNWMYGVLEVEPELEKADAILLLTSGSYGNGLLSRTAYQRVHHALRLYRAGYADRIVVCGGSGVPSRPPEARMMKAVLVEFGVEEERILTEERSRNTYENIFNVLPLLDAEGIREVLMVTSSSHMYRSLRVAERLGLRARAAPVPAYERGLDHFQERSRFIADILREFGAIAYFRLRGWM